VDLFGVGSSVSVMPPPALVIDTACRPRARSGSVSSLEDEDPQLAMSPEDVVRIQEDVAFLIENNVRLVAVDADLTLFRIHTGGKWRGTPEGLARHVRPLFRVFIPECIQAGLRVAVVTFSPQAQLIREALDFALPDVDLSDLLVRGGQRQVMCENGELANVEHWDGSRKQKHIGSVVDCLEERGECLVPQEIVLVDDDLFNVEEARDHGMRGSLFNLDCTVRIQRPRRRGSIVELDVLARSASKHVETTAPKMVRAKSMPPDEVASPSEYCLSAEGI